MDRPFLEIKNLHLNYEQYEVLKGVDLKVQQGDVICITGKNGSGKSTLLKTIAGLIPTKEGEIIFEGTMINNFKVQKRIDLGIGYLMQHNAVFPRLSIADHIQLAARQNKKQSLNEVWKETEKLFPMLVEQKKQVAGRLSGGQRRLLSFALLIAQGADKLWVLDEPSAGIAKGLLGTIAKFLIPYLKNNNLTCLLVEQNLEFGKLITTKQVHLKNHSSLLIQ